MVITCKTKIEWERARNNCINAGGTFFTHERIQRAKDNNLFADIKRAAKMIEDKGGKIYYQCTESELNGNVGKWLNFSFFNCKMEDADGFLGLLQQVKLGNKVIFTNISEVIETKMAWGSMSGSPSCCPLF